MQYHDLENSAIVHTMEWGLLWDAMFLCWFPYEQERATLLVAYNDNTPMVIYDGAA